MPIYKAPLDDIRFVLDEVLDIAKLSALPGHEEHTPDLIQTVLEEGAKLCENELFPLNMSGDAEGCTYENGVVRTPAGFKEAYELFRQGGWVGLSADPRWGGQGLPQTVNFVFEEFLNSTNMSFAMYPGLTKGVYDALRRHGTVEQQDLYLPRLVDGSWSGTMCLTEPHCGTDLGMIRTRAEPDGDGAYRIAGTKIFISAGEHDMAENIIHLVLARIEGAPEGVKGISLFIVPKFFVNADGSVGARNGVMCGSIEHKMGIHGNSTCVMNYDNATGWLLGEPHRGLHAMFTMMNEARLAVGLQGLTQSEVAYQNAANYARDRLQGRSISGVKNPDKPADPIIVHPDIRRVLMSIKSFNEAARALVLWTALRADIQRRSEDEKARQAAEDHMGLMTPVIKGVLTDTGFANTVAAQQVFGGHGYIGEHGMEQFVRDARIAMIYEGANGIQALDLVGRKLGRDGGRAITAFFNEVSAFVKANDDEAMKPYVAPLAESLAQLQQATMWFMQNAMKKPDNAGAGSTDYMHLFGLVALAYMWAQMAKTAQDKLKNGANGAEDRMKAKLVTGKFFMERVLPETAAHLKRITTGADTMMALPAEAF
jgi:acyl-CoA dehydrogenase